MLRRARRKRAALRAIFAAALLLIVVAFANDLLRLLESDAPSVSHGTTANGRLENGKRLPTRGANFATYSRFGSLLGRTAVHGAVRDTLLDAYGRLAETHPDVVWVYGETGWPSGGRLRPHRTHRNGLSVDFMVPLRDAAGRPARIPTWPWKKFGYNVELDAHGRLGDHRLDVAAMAAHLHALAAAAPARGLAIDRVIFDPNLQPLLFAAPGGPALRDRVPFSPKPSWVRHDEHYHVDFRLVR